MIDSHTWGGTEALRSRDSPPERRLAVRLAGFNSDHLVFLGEGDRFRITGDWALGAQGGQFFLEELTEDAAVITLSDGSSNQEGIFRVLRTESSFPVLGALGTTVGYDIQITDTTTGETRHYMNTEGEAACSHVDWPGFPGEGGWMSARPSEFDALW